MAISMKLIAKEILMAGCKSIPFVGPVIDIVDNIAKSHETLHMQNRLDQIENNLTSFDRKMRDLVQGEIETMIAALSRRELDGADFTNQIKNLYAIRQNGWTPALFQGLLERSVHWAELYKNPSHYGNVLSDRDTLDANKLPIFIDADKTRVLELTPFALHALLARQLDDAPSIKIVTSADVWAFVGSGKARAGEVVTNSIGMQFAWIPPGSFMMGSPLNEKDHYADETLHRVTLTKGFLLGIHQVTQAQWQAVMGNNPSRFKGESRPVEKVSWFDAAEFCQELREKEAKLYRLPTEAEWEYACRAGSETAYCFGDSPGVLGEYAWFDDNSGSKTHPVGQKKPNDWRLFDLHGNVHEWCYDKYGPYPAKDVTDPLGAITGDDLAKVVLRGGNFHNGNSSLRSACRREGVPWAQHPLYGFRVCFRLD